MVVVYELGNDVILILLLFDGVAEFHYPWEILMQRQRGILRELTLLL